MKKLLYLSFFLAGFSLISCSSDDSVQEIVDKIDEEKPVNPQDGEGNVVEWGKRADELQQQTYSIYFTTAGTYRQDNTGNESFNYWWNAHMLDVLVDGYERTGDVSYLPKMKELLQGIAVRNGGGFENVYIDDMEWLGIASLRAYEATGDVMYKEVAVTLWEEIKQGWNDVHGGGISWKTDMPNSKNACSNGPAAILAMHLYEIEGNPDDLEWARKIYDWLKETLVDPSTGLVWDNINFQNGEAVTNRDWIFTYNTGTYIGAASLLYEATGNTVYLDDAIKSANSVISPGVLTTGGILKNEGQGDGGLFKGILARYFTQLSLNPDLSVEKQEKYRKFIRFNAQTLLQHGLNSAGLAGPNWSDEPPARVDLSTQLSGIMLMEARTRFE